MHRAPGGLWERRDTLRQGRSALFTKLCVWSCTPTHNSWRLNENRRETFLKWTRSPTNGHAAPAHRQFGYIVGRACRAKGGPLRRRSIAADAVTQEQSKQLQRTQANMRHWTGTNNASQYVPGVGRHRECEFGHKGDNCHNQPRSLRRPCGFRCGEWQWHPAIPADMLRVRIRPAAMLATFKLAMFAHPLGRGYTIPKEPKHVLTKTHYRRA